MPDLIVTIDDAAELLGVSTRRIEQLSGKARAGRGKVDLAVLLPPILADLRHKAETATARRALLEAQTAAKQQEAEIRRHDFVRVTEVRDLVRLVADLLHDFRQQASGAIFYSDPSLSEDVRRRAAYDLDVRLRDDVRRMVARVESALDEFAARKRRGLDLVDD